MDQGTANIDPRGDDAIALRPKKKESNWCTQGTVLDPILFLIFISDIDHNITSFASMFADDTRLVGNIQGVLEKTCHFCFRNFLYL